MGLPLLATPAVLLTAVACSSAVGIFNKVVPETIVESARDAVVDGDYIIWVDCTIKNNGDSGEVEVQANVNPFSGGNWRSTQRVHIKAGEQEVVTFEFPQALELRPNLDHYGISCGSWSPTTF